MIKMQNFGDSRFYIYLYWSLNDFNLEIIFFCPSTPLIIAYRF